MASIAAMYHQEILAGLFGLAAIVGTGEHLDKCAPSLDQLCSRLLQVADALFPHGCLS